MTRPHLLEKVLYSSLVRNAEGIVPGRIVPGPVLWQVGQLNAPTPAALKVLELIAQTQHHLAGSDQAILLTIPTNATRESLLGLRLAIAHGIAENRVVIGVHSEAWSTRCSGIGLDHFTVCPGVTRIRRTALSDAGPDLDLAGIKAYFRISS